MKKTDLKKLQKKGIKARVAILGGGDVIFPIITAGVIFKVWGFIPSIITIFGGLCGLSYLFFFAKNDGTGEHIFNETYGEHEREMRDWGYRQ